MALADFTDLTELDLTPTLYEGVGFSFNMGSELTAIQAVIPVKDLVGLNTRQVVTREDYALDGDDPGNRIVSQAHVRKIKDGLKRGRGRLMVGTLVYAVSPRGITCSPLVPVGDDGSEVKLSRFSIRTGHSMFILDGQHRSRALMELWNDVGQRAASGDVESFALYELLERSSVPVLILLEDRKDEISQMFINLASTKPISPSLIAVMDKDSFANRLGLRVAKSSHLLAHADRLAFQTSTATGDALYAAAAVRGAAASLFIGFRDRSPEIREANLLSVADGISADRDEALGALEHEATELLDYAAERIPGWRDLLQGEIPAVRFRGDYVHGSAAGFYVIAGVICAARLADGVDPRAVIDAMASLFEWRKQVHVDGRHPSFDGTLVVVEPILGDHGQIIDFKTKTGGGNRTAYEKAARTVIKRLVDEHPDFADMESDRVLGELGLKTRTPRV